MRLEETRGYREHILDYQPSDCGHALTSDPGSFGWSNKARPSDSSGAVGTWNQRPILMGVL